MKAAAKPPTAGRANSSEVAERYRPAIYRYILRLVGEPERAEDLTQETFLRVHQHLEKLKDAGALEAWLYRIATNVCYDRFRQRDHREPALPLTSLGDEEVVVPPDEEALRPEQLLEQSEMGDCVLRFLARLPKSQREVLLLHDLQGFTGPEIATRLGLTLHNVKIRLHRARGRLKSALSTGCDFSRTERGVFVCEPKRR